MVGDYMKKIIKKAKYLIAKNEKAFTLIEMLGVIVIIALILIIAIPNLAKILNGNKQQEFDSYYDLVEEAALVYAGKITDELGTSKHSGCKDITLDNLIKEGYLQKFNDSDTTCSTKDSIRIRNERGKITVSFELYCNDEEGEVYRKGKSDTTSSCEPYTEKMEANIKIMLESDETLSNTTPEGSKITYITGDNPNNYIWYSGKMWRVISYDQVTEHVKAVTDDSVTSIYYSHNNSTYPNSDVNTWVNNEFYNSLKNPNQFIVSNNWYYDSSTKYDKQKVGIISEEEYSIVKDWYNDSDSVTWLSSGKRNVSFGDVDCNGTVNNDDLDLLYNYINGTENLIKEQFKNADVNHDGNINLKDWSALMSYLNGKISYGGLQKEASDVIGVRPVVTFSADVMVESGSGTETNPYMIDNTDTAFGKTGELINTRYSGEYVKLGGKLYRIVSVTDDGYTKLIGTTSEGTYVFSDETGGYTYDFTVSNVKTNLLETSGNWYKNLSTAEQLLISNKGQFCLDTINSENPVYLSPRCMSEGRLRTSKVGLPKMGDFFTSSIENVGEFYWTINPETESNAVGTQYDAKINIITPTGAVINANITDSNATVVVFYLNSNVKIKSGNGMKNTPYELQ